MRGFDSQLTLQKLEVFCVVAELQSMTRAAGHLFITQPVVTSHVKGLEEKLGVKLLRREGRGIVLTAEGQRVLKWAREVVTRTRELERELGGASPGGPGKVVVSSSMSVGSYLLPSLICDFQLRRPDGLVQLLVSNPIVALDEVRSGASDFAVVLVAPQQNLDGLVVRALWDEPLLLCSAPKSQWVGDSVRRDKISQLPFISTTNSFVMQQLEEGQLRVNGIASRRVIMTLGHPEGQKEALKRDAGVCLLLRSSAAAELARGELRVVKTPGVKLSIPIYIAHRKDKEFSPFQLVLKQHFESARPAGLKPFKST